MAHVPSVLDGPAPQQAIAAPGRVPFWSRPWPAPARQSPSRGPWRTAFRRGHTSASCIIANVPETHRGRGWLRRPPRMTSNPRSRINSGLYGAALHSRIWTPPANRKLDPVCRRHR